MDENIAVVYHNRGLAYLKKGDYQKAKLDLEDALELDADNPEHQIQLDIAIKKLNASME